MYFTSSLITFWEGPGNGKRVCDTIKVKISDLWQSHQFHSCRWSIYKQVCARVLVNKTWKEVCFESRGKGGKAVLLGTLSFFLQWETQEDIVPFLRTWINKHVAPSDCKGTVSGRKVTLRIAEGKRTLMTLLLSILRLEATNTRKPTYKCKLWVYGADRNTLRFCFHKVHLP